MTTNLFIKLTNVFVSECSSVNISHCMKVCNNGRIRQHPRSFPTQNMKINSWYTFHLLLLLSLFPLWSWLKAASRKMIMTLSDNVFILVHPKYKNMCKFLKNNVFFLQRQKSVLFFSYLFIYSYLFFSFQGYLIFLLISPYNLLFLTFS